jgi:hypothetical protein
MIAGRSSGISRARRQITGGPAVATDAVGTPATARADHRRAVQAIATVAAISIAENRT